MIREIKGERLRRLFLADPFFVRIQSLSLCYGGSYDFISFYEQTEEQGEAVAFCAVFESRMSLFLTERADLEEISGFVRFSGCACVMADASFSLDLNSSKELSGDVLCYRKSLFLTENEIIEPEIREFYDVLKSCEREDFIVPEYLPFLSDVTHRRNMGRCTLSGIEREGVLASVAMTVSEGESAVIIGAVATREEFRRQGLSRCIVISLAEKYKAMGKAVFVFSANEKNTRFYERSGFEKTARFTEKFFDR